MEQTKTNYDEYLTRRARNRKIAMAVTSVIVALLAITIIVLSFVKINNRPQFVNAADTVEIINPNNASDARRRDKGSKEYDEFYSVLNDCFEMSVLSSIFSNNFGDYQFTEVQKNSSDQYELIPYNREIDIKEIGDSAYYARFSYNKPQSITYRNGSFYRSGWNSDKVGNVNAENQSNVISFKTVLFALSNKNELADLNFYLIVDGYKTDSQNILKVTVKANTYALYQSLGLEEK